MMINKHQRLIDQIKGVLFDMDGVIIDGMPYHAKAWKLAFQEIGLTIASREVYEREGESGIAAVSLFLGKRNIVLEEAEVRALMDRKEAIFKEIVEVKPFQGIHQLLDNLLMRNKRIALVTGTARHELMHSLPLELQNKFELMITGDEVSRGKPHPEPYLKALEKMALQPSDVVVVENAPLGIESAKQADCYCLAVATSLPASYLHQADQCFDDINALAGYLFKEDDSLAGQSENR